MWPEFHEFWPFTFLLSYEPHSRTSLNDFATLSSALEKRKGERQRKKEKERDRKQAASHDTKPARSPNQSIPYFVHDTLTFTKSNLWKKIKQQQRKRINKKTLTHIHMA